MSLRLRGAELLSLGLLGIPLSFSVGQYGLGMAIPPLIAGVAFAVWSWWLPRFRRPGLSMLGIWAFAHAMVLLAIALADGEHRYVFMMTLVPTLIAAATLNRQVVLIGTGVTIATLVPVALLVAGDEVGAMPPLLVVPGAVLLMTVVVASGIRDVDVVSRGTAVVDPLTGVLNRLALQARLSELEAQSRAAPRPVAMVLADVDRFKAINDELGHRAGDRALTDIAARMRRALGDLGTLYRFGGEEFVVLLTEGVVGGAAEVAERLREAVSATTISGRVVTVSFGVATADPDAPLDQHVLFDAADRALYAAKHAGRDRVEVASERLAPRRFDRRRAAAAPVVDGARPETPPLALADPAVERGSKRTSSWLIRNSVQRQQLIEVIARAEETTKASNAVGVLMMLSCVPWLGWAYVVPGAVIATLFRPVMRRARDVRRPEYLILANVLGSIAAMGAAILLAGPVALFALPMFALFLVIPCAAFPARGAWVSWGIAAAVMAGVAFALDPHGAVHDAGVLIVPEGLLASTCLLSRAVGRSSTEHRSAAIVCPLTGVLNRVALDARLPEVEHESGDAGRPVSLLVADLDHFKAINDLHGHETGDAVLAGVAARLRDELRLSDAVYRIGGEEFVVLLDGVAPDEAVVVAERLRAVTEETEVAGLPVSVSIGVAGTQPAQRFRYADTFAAADAALYAAKRAGRNRVVAADEPGEALAA